MLPYFFTILILKIYILSRFSYREQYSVEYNITDVKIKNIRKGGVFYSIYIDKSDLIRKI